MFKSLCVVLMLAASALGGCASRPDAASIQRDEAALEAQRDRAAQARADRASAQAEKYLKQVPEWVNSPPRTDGTYVYAVGSGMSQKFDLARQKAQLHAEFGLAKQYRQALSGSERMYQRDGGGIGGVQERYTLLIDKLVDRVQLVGHEVAKTETIVVDGQFQTWVLMKLSFDEMQRVLARQRASSDDASIDRQFDALDQRLKDYREERRKDLSANTGAESGPLGVAPPAVAETTAAGMPTNQE